MTPDEREEMNNLCAPIQTGKDHKKFTSYIARLIEQLGRKERRLSEQDKKQS